MNSKVIGSAAIDFGITFLTAFLAIPQDADITTRSLIAMIGGSLLQVLKGVKTYYATYPTKEEIPK